VKRQFNNDTPLKGACATERSQDNVIKLIIQAARVARVCCSHSLSAILQTPCFSFSNSPNCCSCYVFDNRSNKEKTDGALFLIETESLHALLEKNTMLDILNVLLHMKFQRAPSCFGL